MRQNVPKRSYITTAAYASHIYLYSRTYDAGTYTWSGSFTAATIPSGLNVAGVILRETGRKLYPTANPGVTRYMVGVYHEDIGTAFIDPNCSVFATFSTDKPEYIPNNTDDQYTPLEDQGNPVFTLGDITTTKGNIKANIGSLYVSSDAGATGSVLVGPNASVGVGVYNAIAVNATATTDNQIITSGPIAATTAAGTITAYGNIATTNGSMSSYGNITTSNGYMAASYVETYTVTSTSQTVSIDSTKGNLFKIVLNIGSSTVTSITLSAGVGAAGQHICILISNPSSFNQTIDFNSPFFTNFSTGPGQYTINTGFNRPLTTSFISDGINGFYMLSAMQLVNNS